MSQQFNNSDEIISLRGTLGQFPTGVAIVTALTKNHQPAGMTINSFNSVSLTPALVSWCIDRQAAGYETFAKVKSFAVTVLAEGQAELATRFATRGANKFRGIENIGNDAPIIPHGCAWFKCEAYQSIILGDHTMLVGRVIEFAKKPIPPLVFRGGQFQATRAIRGGCDPGGGLEPVKLKLTGQCFLCRRQGTGSHYRAPGDMGYALGPGDPALMKMAADD